MMEAGLLDQNRSSILGNDDIQPPPDSRRSEDPPYKQMSDDPGINVLLHIIGLTS